MNNMEKKNFLSYSLFSERLSELPAEAPLMINTINQYSYCMAEKDSLYKKSLLESDVLLPDGISIVLAAKFLNNTTLKKIAGADVHKHFLRELNQVSGSCFYLGASERVLRLIKRKIERNYPNVRVGSYSPPYKPAFSNTDNEEMVEAINNFAPDVLFVGMTAPKQEKWVYQNRGSLNVRVICTIGAVFDFYAGVIMRPGKIWIDLGLEWLGRLYSEPRRLAKRYLYYGPVFIYLMLAAKLKGEKTLWPREWLVEKKTGTIR